MMDSPELLRQESDYFRGRLDNILSRQLTPENLETYAEDALDQFIALAQDSVNHYNFQPTLTYQTLRDQEEAAFRYHGLGDIGHTLDHIDAKAQEIKDLDAVIRRAPSTPKVILPPDSDGPRIMPGEGDGVKNAVIPRLKTLLFVASNGLGIDINDPQQLQITRGALTTEMMRKSPYYLVEFPTLERAVLVCDEEGNATFVLHTAILAEHGINTDEVITLNKSDIDDFIREYPSLGTKMHYRSESYVAGLQYNLTSDWTKNRGADDAQETEQSYLYPVAPEGYMVADAISRTLGVSRPSVDNAIKELGLEPETYRRQSSPRGKALFRYYSPEAVETIRISLEENGLFLPEPPEDYISLEMLKQDWGGVSNHSIRRAINELGLTGTAFRVKGQRQRYYYSPEEVSAIHAAIEQKGLFIPTAPDGYMALTELGNSLGIINPSAIQRAVAELGITTEVFRVQNGTTAHYSPESIARIRSYLAEQGHFNPHAPEGHLIISEIVEKIGVGLDAVKDVITKLGIAGETYKGRAKRPQTYYGPDDIEQIRAYLDEAGRLDLKQAPNDYMHQDMIARATGVSITLVVKAIKQLQLQGEAYRTLKQNRRIDHYSPSQIEAIRAWIGSSREGAYLTKDDEWITANGLARILDLDVTTIHRGLKAAGITGHQFIQKTTGKAYQQYSRQETEALRHYLIENGYFAEYAPEDALTRTNMQRLWSVGYQVITKAIKAVGAEPQVYKSPLTNRPEKYYAAEDVTKIQTKIEMMQSARRTRLGRAALRETNQG